MINLIVLPTFSNRKETDYQKLEERIHFAIQEAEEVKSANRELVM